MLTTALALLGFSVVAAILLMRTRRARGQQRDAAALRNPGPAGRGRPVPRAAVRRTADPDLLGRPATTGPQISGDISLLMPPDAQHYQPQRILAFGTWLPPEPALQMDHAVDALREAGEGFLLNLTTSNGRAFEAMGRAIGGQAIVRIRELSGLRRELAETNLRHKALLEETEMLRGFAAAAPWPIWAKRANGGLSYANAAYARATEAASVADAISRDLELLDSGDRGEMDRALNDTCRLHRAAADRGRRRAALLRCARRQCRRRQRRHRHRRQRSHRAAARRWCGWRRRIAAPSTSCRPASPCSTASGGSPSTTIPIAGCGISTAPSSTAIPTIPACSTGCAPRANCRSSRISAPGRRSCTRPIARSSPKRTPGICPTAARSASSPRPIRKAASPICSTTSPKASTWRGDSTA